MTVFMRHVFIVEYTNFTRKCSAQRLRLNKTIVNTSTHYDNLKEYVDSQGGKGAYENSLKSWDNKRELSKIKIMYQGKEQR